MVEWNIQVSEGNDNIQVVLTKPLSVDGDVTADYKAPNLVQRMLSLIRECTARIGSHKLQGNSASTSIQHSKSPSSNVMRGAYPLHGLPLLVLPLTIPILGETHHVSRGSLNVLLEQVSHHPPVSALHATDEKENIELIWCQHPVPKFYGLIGSAK
ncbi:hypothetical protein OIU78_024315 [Salix suchowensis]|nr:hypothetical protein OIU78_024315 [Salix suchowensis]